MAVHVNIKRKGGMVKLRLCQSELSGFSCVSSDYCPQQVIDTHPATPHHCHLRWNAPVIRLRLYRQPDRHRIWSWVMARRYPTPVLRDRIATAAELYFNGKVEMLCLVVITASFTITSQEPCTNTPSVWVFLRSYRARFCWRSTYDTCYRAKEIFGIKEAILVTQYFHLPRALYICHVLGSTLLAYPQIVANIQLVLGYIGISASYPLL